jgi:hypothetical protein
VAQGAVPLEQFYWYMRTDDGELKMINWQPQKVADFRWMDAIQAKLQFPEARTYALTLKAAAKCFDEEPLAQPNWEAILAMRKKVVRNERPEPRFRIFVDGKPAGLAKPEGGALKPFVTPPVKEGWATLDPKDEELTTFTAQVDAAAGPHVLAIQAENMQDCYVKILEIR